VRGEAVEELFDAGGDISSGQMTVGEPHKGKHQRLVGRESSGETVLTHTVGLTYLTLHTIAVNGMVEAALGNTDEHLDGLIGLTALPHMIDQS
jgi:hypothetical protein